MLRIYLTERLGVEAALSVGILVNVEVNLLLVGNILSIRAVCYQYGKFFDSLRTVDV